MFKKSNVLKVVFGSTITTCQLLTKTKRVMDAKTRVQEVIDKLEQYKEVAGNARVYVHGDCQDKNY